MTPLIELDVDRSTIRLAGTTLPLVVLVCPKHDDEPDRSPGSFALASELRRGVNGFVPMENGAVADVYQGEDRRIFLSLYSHRCIEYEPVHPEDTPSWIPGPLQPVDGRLVSGIKNTIRWHDCEPDWVVETIHRMSRLPVDHPDGPACRIVTYAEGQAMLNEALA